MRSAAPVLTKRNERWGCEAGRDISPLQDSTAPQPSRMKAVRSTETQCASHRPRSLPTAIFGVFPESRAPCWEPLPSNVLKPTTNRPGSQEAFRVQAEDREGAVLRPWL